VVSVQPYRVIEPLGDHVELRAYPAHRVVSVDVQAGLEEAGTLGFGPLVGYISGRNEHSQRVAMTSPVLLQPRNVDRHVVSFVLPEEWWTKDAPVPSSNRVWIEDRPEVTMAAIRFRGMWKEARVLEREEALRHVLHTQGIQITGGPLFARYDPPAVPGFLRRNEVLLPVSR
jgi:hypothetical protein